MKNDASDIIEQTLNFWGKRTGKNLSREDAREMVVNVSGFFQVLAEWDRKARMEACSEDGEKIGLDEMTQPQGDALQEWSGSRAVAGETLSWMICDLRKHIPNEKPQLDEATNATC